MDVRSRTDGRLHRIHRRAHHRKGAAGYLPQELPEAEKTKTVYEYFYEKEKFWDQTPKDLAVLARKFGLTEEFFYRDQQMSELSGGEKVKAQMMRLLMEDVTVLLLDEPSNDIDLATLELLEKLTANGSILLFLFRTMKR